MVTQYKSHSLLRHLQRGWSFLRAELNEMVDVLPAQQRVDEEHWYRGTADAVYQNLDIIQTRSTPHDYIVVLAGDHVYKMDYSIMLTRPRRSTARGCTVGCIEVPRMEAVAFGVMAVDDERRITAFVEKPADPPAMPGQPDIALASMGIYVFDAEYLYRLLEEDMRRPRLEPRLRQGHHPARGAPRAARWRIRSACRASRKPDTARRRYWRDVGTIDAFWAANLDLASINPELDIYDTDWPIWTYQRQLPPAKFVPDRDGKHGMTVNTIVSGGCIVVGLARARIRCCSPACACIPSAASSRRCCCPTSRSAAAAGCSKVVIDRALRDCPRAWWSARTRRSTRARFERTDSGVVLITREMLERLGARTCKRPMRILQVSAELFPLLKTGGLADVAGALPRGAGGRRRRTCGCCCRAFRRSATACADAAPVAELQRALGRARARCAAGASRPPARPTCRPTVIDAPALYDRAGQSVRRRAAAALRRQPPPLRAARLGRGAAGAGARPGLAARSGACARLACRAGAGLPGVRAAAARPPRVGSVFTVHNLAYQGAVRALALRRARPAGRAFGIDGLEFHGQLSFMKAGLYFADRITTVSPTYAREIQTPEQGCGLDGLLRSRARRAERHPQRRRRRRSGTRPPTRYLPHALRRAAHRRQGALQGGAAAASSGLAPAPDAPLFVLVSRLTEQKGLHLVLAGLDALLAQGGQLALLGSGDAALEAAFRAARRRRAASRSAPPSATTRRSRTASSAPAT